MMQHSDALAWIDDALSQRDRDGLLRSRRLRTSQSDDLGHGRLTLDGHALVNFGSNDYLGLAGDPRLRRAVKTALDDGDWGSGASALVTGYDQRHRQLEEALAQFEGVDATLLFGSGFAANAGSVAALVGQGDVVFADARNHASLWDGCRLSRADVRAYPHLDFASLERLLQRSRSQYHRCLIVTDSLFSIDGDFAPLDALADLAEAFDSMLLVDEAHATGVFGKHGRGWAEHLGVEDRIAVRIGTLSKAAGSIGGFAAGPRKLIDYLVNRARPYIYSTAPPAAICAAGLEAIRIVGDEPHRRERLRRDALTFREQLADDGWTIPPGESQIIPVVIGDPRKAVACSEALQDRGFFVPALRPPTVPEGASCLRISLSFAHTEEQREELLAALDAARQASVE